MSCKFVKVQKKITHNDLNPKGWNPILAADIKEVNRNSWIIYCIAVQIFYCDIESNNYNNTNDMNK